MNRQLSGQVDRDRHFYCGQVNEFRDVYLVREIEMDRSIGRYKDRQIDRYTNRQIVEKTDTYVTSYTDRLMNREVNIYIQGERKREYSFHLSEYKRHYHKTRNKPKQIRSYSLFITRTRMLKKNNFLQMNNISVSIHTSEQALVAQLKSRSLASLKLGVRSRFSPPDKGFGALEAII